MNWEVGGRWVDRIPGYWLAYIGYIITHYRWLQHTATQSQHPSDSAMRSASVVPVPNPSLPYPITTGQPHSIIEN